MIIELDTSKSRDGLIICVIFTAVNVLICDDWKLWHILFRMFWISFISGLIQFTYLHSMLKSIPIIRTSIFIMVFGILCTFEIFFFVHLDIIQIIGNKKELILNNILLDILMIDIQCSYMQTLCAALWMFVKLSKHFGYMNEWKFVLKTILPHFITLFIISLCPILEIKYWWISLRLYSSINSIIKLIFDQGLTSLFSTKYGEIGIKNRSLNNNDIKSFLSTKIELILNILSIIRHIYFMLFISSWLMTILLTGNLYMMWKKYRLRGGVTQYLETTLKL